MDLRGQKEITKKGENGHFLDIQRDTEGDRDIVTYKDNETEKETDQKTEKVKSEETEKKTEKRTKKESEQETQKTEMETL